MNAKNFMQSQLRKIIIKNNKEKIFDPIRQKFCNVAPEEIVRQHLISFLIDEFQIPENMICVEEHLRHYDIDSDERADVIVNYEDERYIYPLLVIECKAPEIFLSDQAREQLFGYSEKLGNKYCWLTNGDENYFYCLDDDEYIEIDDLPTYAEMLAGKYNPAPVEEFESRAELEDLEERYFDYVDKGSIGDDTPKNLAIPMTNFLECLLDIKHKLPAKKYKIFRVIEDYGIRNLNVGNGGGGNFSGSYRSFLLEYNGDKTVVSFLVSSYSTFSDMDTIKTSINVAIDKDNGTTHNSLQLVTDKNFVNYDKKIRVLHDGLITKFRGRLPTDGLRKLVAEKYPEIIYGKKFYLGTLMHNRLWYLDDEEVMQVIENLISYALIRDDYRAMF